MKDVGYEKLIIYQKAKKLVLLIYTLTDSWPKEELYGLTSQIRRAVVSIVANVVEGYSRGGTKEFIRYLEIALGSLIECEVYLEIAESLKFSSAEEIRRRRDLLVEVKKLIYSFKKSLKMRIK